MLVVIIDKKLDIATGILGFFVVNLMVFLLFYCLQKVISGVFFKDPKVYRIHASYLFYLDNIVAWI